MRSGLADGWRPVAAGTPRYTVPKFTVHISSGKTFRGRCWLIYTESPWEQTGGAFKGTKMWPHFWLMIRQTVTPDGWNHQSTKTKVPQFCEEVIIHCTDRI